VADALLPSPDRDDGYDIVDFYGVDPRLGSLGDLVEVIRTARDRGMRVIADLVVNHTSDKHPWFTAARADRNSKYRDFYVWSDDPPKEAQAEPTFPDQEKGVWTFDEKAGQYYLHRFYKHQPDLNVANPLVRDEIAKIMASGPSSGCPASGSTRCRSSWRPWGCRTPRRRCPTRTSTSGTCGRCSTAGSGTPSCWARSTCSTPTS
jgi:hypothetical protein